MLPVSEKLMAGEGVAMVTDPKASDVGVAVAEGGGVNLYILPLEGLFVNVVEPVVEVVGVAPTPFRQSTLPLPVATADMPMIYPP